MVDPSLPNKDEEKAKQNAICACLRVLRPEPCILRLRLLWTPARSLTPLLI